MKFKNLKALAPVAIFFVVLFIISISIPQEAMRFYIQQVGAFGPFLFVLFSLLTYVIAPLSGTPLTFVGHVLFKEKVVLWLTLSAYIGFIINFWISRLWGRPLVKKLVGESGLKKADEFVSDYGLMSLFIFRIFLGGLNDLVSYAAGLTTMKFSHYLIVSTIAIIPGTLLWYYLTSLVSNSLAFALISLGLGYLFILFYVLVIKRIKKN